MSDDKLGETQVDQNEDEFVESDHLDTREDLNSENSSDDAREDPVGANDGNSDNIGIIGEHNAGSIGNGSTENLSQDELLDKIESLKAEIIKKNAKENKELLKLIKRGSIFDLGSLIILIALFVLSGISWLANNKMQSLADGLSAKIETFSAMESLIDSFSGDLALAAATSAELESEILGFEGSLDIATEQISLRYEEQKQGIEGQIDLLNNTVEVLRDEFLEFQVSNRSMEIELRRVIQATQQLRELESLLSALITLEKDKYYDAITALNRPEGTSSEAEKESAPEQKESGEIFYSRKRSD